MTFVVVPALVIEGFVRRNISLVYIPFVNRCVAKSGGLKLCYASVSRRKS